MEWSFDALGADWTQAVHFVDQSTDAITMGPFQSVRETGMLVLAEGNSGERGDYFYYVSAIRLDGDGALSLTARTEQDSVGYHNGDVLIFQFYGLPTGAVPELVFDSYTASDSATTPPSYQYGPFSSLTWIASKNLLIGSGESGSYGSWNFEIDLVVVDDEGVPTRYPVKIEKGPDPVIDSEDYPVIG